MLEKCRLHKLTVKMSTLNNIHPSYSKKSYKNLHFEMFSPPAKTGKERRSEIAVINTEYRNQSN